MSTEPNDDTEAAILEDAIALCHRLKGDRRLWNGEVGMTQNRREDVNDLIDRYNQHKKAAK